MTYSTGRDGTTSTPNLPSATNCPELAGNTKACRQITAMVKYNAPSYGVALGYDQSHGNAGAFDPNQPYGGPGNGAVGTLSAPNNTVTLNILTGYYERGDTRLESGWIKRTTATASIYRTNQYWLGARHNLTGNTRLFDVLTWLTSGSNVDANVSLAILRTEYGLPKRTYLYASYAHANNKGALAHTDAGSGLSTVNRAAQHSLLLGIDHSF